MTIGNLYPNVGRLWEDWYGDGKIPPDDEDITDFLDYHNLYLFVDYKRYWFYHLQFHEYSEREEFNSKNEALEHGQMRAFELLEAYSVLSP